VPDTPGISGVILDADDIPDADIPIVALISKGFRTFEGGNIPTFLDSGASDTMFVARDAFTEYKAITLQSGDSAKAIDGDFEIVGEGTVIRRYLMNGKEKWITYT
jgi:hypothetical protein